VGVVGGVEVERSCRIRNLRPDVVRQDAAPALRLNVVLFPALSVAQKLLYQHIMRPRLTSLAVALMVSVASVCYAQPATTNQTRDTPDFTVQVWGYILADFSARVWDYSDLRSELEKGLPPLTVNDDPAEIRRAVRALAKRIRVARAGAKQGDIFTPSISVEFRRALILELDANTGRPSWTTIPASSRIRSTAPTRKESRSRRCRPTSWLCYRGFLTTSSIVFWDAISSCSIRGRT
jgi:hypothetical protein